MSASLAGNVAGISSEQNVRATENLATASQITAMAASVGNSAAGITSEQTVRSTAQEALASQVNVFAAAVGDSASAIKSEQTVRATAQEALASQGTTLATSVGSSIAGITNEQSVRATETTAVAQQVSGLAVATSYGQSAIQTEQTTRSNAQESLASQTTTLASAFGSNQAGIVGAVSTLTTADSATALAINGLASSVGNALAGVVSEQSARTTENSAQATLIDSLSSTVNNPTTGVVATAGALSALSVTVDENDGTLASTVTDVTTLQSRVTGIRKWENTVNVNGDDANLIKAVLTEADKVTPLVAGGPYQSHGDVAFRVSGRVTATGTPTGAVSVFTSTWNGSGWVWSQKVISENGTSSNHVRFYLDAGVPSVRLYGHTVTYGVAYAVELLMSGYSAEASIQTEATTRATETGDLQAKYTVKVDVNGYVAGFGLASTANNGVPTSEFAIVADKFSIAPVQTDNTASDGSPFFYRTTATTINGVSVPAGAYMKAAYIHDASITNAKIMDATIDSAKIASLAADKIAAGSLAASQYIQSSNYVVGTTGWRINADGTAEFSGVTARGTLDGAIINGGVITGATMQTDTTGQRIVLDDNGLLFLTGATYGKYGTFKYGAKKYGSGVLVYFNDRTKKVPFYVSGEQNVADIHLYNRGANPTGGTYEDGDMIVVGGRLRIYVTALGGWKQVALE